MPPARFIQRKTRHRWLDCWSVTPSCPVSPSTNGGQEMGMDFLQRFWSKPPDQRVSVLEDFVITSVVFAGLDVLHPLIGRDFEK